VADAVRPIWLMFAATERAARPFVANLQTGHRAAVVAAASTPYGSPRPIAHFELLKSAGYKFVWQRITGRQDGPLALVTAYLPDLFILDPGMIDPEGIQFIALTPTWWAEQEYAGLRQDPAACAAIQAHSTNLGSQFAARRRFTPDKLLRLVPQAVHCGSFLERRTPRPLVSSLAFYLQLFLAGLENGILTLAHRTRAGDHQPIRDDTDRWAWARHTTAPPVTACNLSTVGLELPAACKVSHEQLDQFLADQVRRYFAAQAIPGRRAA
jgi:hypothetical protein